MIILKSFKRALGSAIGGEGGEGAVIKCPKLEISSFKILHFNMQDYTKT